MTKVIINGAKGRMGETLLRCGETNPDIEIVGYETFGNLHGSDEKERVGRLPDDLRNRGVDAVVAGMGC